MLGDFLWRLFCDTSGVSSAVTEAKKKVGDLASAVKSVGDKGMTVPGADKTAGLLQRSADAAKGLGEQLTALAGIDLAGLMKLGSMAGMVAGLTAATKKFMDLSDETANFKLRFKSLGLESEENTKKLYAYGKAAQEQFGIGQAEARKMGEQMMLKGINPTRYQQMTTSALGLAAAAGIGQEQAMRMIQMVEAGNMQVLRRILIFRQMLDMGMGRFQIEQKLNEMIAGGNEMAKERMNTFRGQTDRLKNAFVDLYAAVARAVGPAFAPLVRRMADAMEGLTRKVEAFVEKNGAMAAAMVRGAAGFAAGLFALRHMGTALSLAGQGIGLFIPGLDMLKGALSAGWGFSPFALIKGGIKGLVGGIKGVVLSARIAGLKAALFLFSPMSMGRALVAAALSPVTALIKGVGIAGKLAGVGVRIFSMSLKGLLLASGIGILIGLIGMLAGVGDTFGDSSGGIQQFGDSLRQAFDGLMEAAKPVLDWVRVEGVIVFKALVASARQFVDNAKLVWAQLRQAWDDVVKFFREHFGGALAWFEETTGVRIGSMQEMWAEFTAELAVLGLRMRQVALAIGIGFAAIPAVLKWIWGVLKSLGEFIVNNFTSFVREGAMTVVRYFELIGTAARDVGESIRQALNGEEVTFDFSRTRGAFDALKNQANKVFEDLKLPKLDLSQVAPEMQAQLRQVTDQINDAKQRAREAQAKDRTALQNRGTGKTDGDAAKAGPLQGGVLVGGRDKSSFSDVGSFWKKVQEAAANQRIEFIAQQQLVEQQKMTSILGQIRDNQNRAGGAKPAAAGGLVPRDSP
jgi:hypothetical protein